MLQPLRFLLILLALGDLSGPLSAEDPESLHAEVSVRTVFSTETDDNIRIDFDPVGESLYYAERNGNIYRIALDPDGNGTKTLAFTSEGHGASSIWGMAFDSKGNLFLVENEVSENNTLNVGRVHRGVAGKNGERLWSVVMETVPYPRSNTAFDHNFNCVVVDPDDRYLYINSGSRTDHGEAQSAGGVFPNEREVPLTSAIFRIPTDAEGLTLQNNEDWLRSNGYLFADGVRNAFDLDIGPGPGYHLFGVENSGDRDDPEEMNWYQEGRHYGFPWTMGGNFTPMQEPDFVVEDDVFLQENSWARLKGYFHNDPDYPAMPIGMEFVEPFLNRGPDADLLRLPDGTVVDAGEDNKAMGTFTPHRSPLGLEFDRAGALAAPFTRDAFAMSFTNGGLSTAFSDDSQDLLHIELEKTGSTYEVHCTKLVIGIDEPIDGVLVGNKYYVLERGGGKDLLEVLLPAAPVFHPPTAVINTDLAEGGAPLTVAFDGENSSDPDRDIVSYTWDFGDGSMADGSQTTHTYRHVGNYTVKLIVADARDHKTGTEVLIRVVPPENAPTALVMVEAPETPSVLETQILERLTRLGFRMQTVEATADVAAIENSFLLLNTPVSDRAHEFAGMRVPIVVWETDWFPLLGMTGRAKDEDFGMLDGLVQAKITEDPQHNITELIGNVSLLSEESSGGWGRPVADGFSVATFPDDSDRAVVFGYEQHAQTALGIAPQRRAALFFDSISPARLTGEAWVLFEDTVRWAAAGTDLPDEIALDATAEWGDFTGNGERILTWRPSVPHQIEAYRVESSADLKLWNVIEPWTGVEGLDLLDGLETIVTTEPESDRYFRLRIR